MGNVLKEILGLSKGRLNPPADLPRSLGIYSSDQWLSASDVHHVQYGRRRCTGGGCRSSVSHNPFPGQFQSLGLDGRELLNQISNPHDYGRPVLFRRLSVCEDDVDRNFFAPVFEHLVQRVRDDRDLGSGCQGSLIAVSAISPEGNQGEEGHGRSRQGVQVTNPARLDKIGLHPAVPG